MEEEIWKDIENYEGYYQVSDKGNVRSVDRETVGKDGFIYHYKGRLLKLFYNHKGYLQCYLTKNSKTKTFIVHRLVAQAFIPNPDNLPQVNHISQVKTENRVENLEYCDAKYNVNYGTRNQRSAEKLRGKQINDPKRSKQVYQYSLNGELVTIYPSTNECGRNGFCQSTVAECCKGGGRYKTHKGYIWRYEPL